MANSAQARKRARQAETARQHSASQRSRFRTAIKKVLKAIDQKDSAAAAESFKEAVPVIDTMVNKKIIHQNKAARHKSRLSKQIRALS